MRALVCREFGIADQLQIEDLPLPAVAAGQVRIAVQAAALNFPDWLAIAGKYQIRAPVVAAVLLRK